MRRFLLIALATATFMTGCATNPNPSAPPVSPVDTHVANATAIAGEDLKNLLPVCNAQPAVRPGSAVIEPLLTSWITAPPPEPGQAFDNLYYVGSAAVSAWVIKTSQGLILIDAMNNAPVKIDGAATYEAEQRLSAAGI